MNTKYFVGLFFIASAAAITWPDPHRVIRETCANKSGLSEEQLLIRSQVRFDASLLPYIVCFAEHLNAVNNTGVFSEDVAVNILAHAIPPPMARATMRCCQHRVLESGATTQAERIIRVVQCFWSKIPTVLYNLIGFWGKPVFHHLDTCDVE